jgi:hypothetical protein
LRNPANLIKGLQKLPNWYPHASGQQEGQIKNHTKRGPTTNKERANSSSKERTKPHIISQKEVNTRTSTANNATEPKGAKPTKEERNLNKRHQGFGKGKKDR